MSADTNDTHVVGAVPPWPPGQAQGPAPTWVLLSPNSELQSPN